MGSSHIQDVRVTGSPIVRASVFHVFRGAIVSVSGAVPLWCAVHNLESCSGHLAGHRDLVSHIKMVGWLSGSHCFRRG